MAWLVALIALLVGKFFLFSIVLICLFLELLLVISLVWFSTHIELFLGRLLFLRDLSFFQFDRNKNIVRERGLGLLLGFDKRRVSLRKRIENHHCPIFFFNLDSDVGKIDHHFVEFVEAL